MKSGGADRGPGNTEYMGCRAGRGGVRVDQVQEMNKINAEIEQKQSWESPVALKAQPVSTVLR